MAQAARTLTAKDPGEKLAHRRLTVLELAQRLGNVSEACRRGGIDRTSRIITAGNPLQLGRLVVRALGKGAMPGGKDPHFFIGLPGAWDFRKTMSSSGGRLLDHRAERQGVGWVPLRQALELLDGRARIELAQLVRLQFGDAGDVGEHRLGEHATRLAGSRKERSISSLLSRVRSPSAFTL
jgi:hypothetical protein